MEGVYTINEYDEHISLRKRLDPVVKEQMYYAVVFGTSFDELLAIFGEENVDAFFSDPDAPGDF